MGRCPQRGLRVGVFSPASAKLDELDHRETIPHQYRASCAVDEEPVRSRSHRFAADGCVPVGQAIRPSVSFRRVLPGHRLVYHPWATFPPCVGDHSNSAPHRGRCRTPARSRPEYLLPPESENRTGHHGTFEHLHSYFTKKTVLLARAVFNFVARHFMCRWAGHKTPRYICCFSKRCFTAFQSTAFINASI